MLYVWWPRLGLCAFDHNRARCVALYEGLNMQTPVVLFPGLCELELWLPSPGLSAFDVNRTRCAALCVGLYVTSRVVPLRDYVRSTCGGRG